jgi:hypothetical protein
VVLRSIDALAGRGAADAILEPMPNASPRIRSLQWGSISTEAGTFRDAKLWPGGGSGWDWRETGTDHDSGIQPADVTELVDRGAHILVLGRGQHGRLQVPPETLAVIRDRGVTVEVLLSGEAVDRYNALVDEGAAVGALIHTTC